MQVVGIFALVASLVFVGLQMQQAQNIAVGAQYQERTAATIESISARSQIDVLSVQVGTNISERYAAYDSIERTPAQLGALFFAMRLSLTSMDNVHFQWESGFMNDDSWNAYRAQLRFAMSNPMGRFILENFGDYYRPSFREICLELIAENEFVSN